MIEYSRSARRAVALLMRPYNDIDIYVEDRTFVGVYEKIVNNCLNGSARVTKVIPLGPRDVVIAAASADDGADRRPKLYIVDGDLDVISSMRGRRIDRLHRLRVYSLENLVFEPGSLEAYCALVCPMLEAVEAIDALQLGKMERIIERVSRTYIAALAVARRLKLRGNEFAFDYKSVFVKSSGFRTALDQKRLRAKTVGVINAIKKQAGEEKYRKAKVLVFKSIRAKGLKGVEYFPGKGLLWHLNERSGLAGGLSLQQKVIVSYLAQRCSLTRDVELARRIRLTSKEVMSSR